MTDIDMTVKNIARVMPRTITEIERLEHAGCSVRMTVRAEGFVFTFVCNGRKYELPNRWEPDDQVARAIRSIAVLIIGESGGQRP